MTESKLKKALAKRNLAITNLAFSMKTMSHPTALKYAPTPEKYTFEQLEEIADYMDIEIDLLLIELDLI